MDYVVIGQMDCFWDIFAELFTKRAPTFQTAACWKINGAGYLSV
jgi:hypothetical protein